MIDLYQELNIDKLRGRFIKYTKEVYHRLCLPNKPRILDIGCGRGLPTVELALLSGGEIIGIDTDALALNVLRKRADQLNLLSQITIMQKSLYDVEFESKSFDLLWAEGVLHALDISRSLKICWRLLRSDGLLVMHETVNWFKSMSATFSRFGFSTIEQCLLPKHYWWTAYGAALDERVKRLKKKYPASKLYPDLSRYESEVSALREDPEHFDCGFFVVQKKLPSTKTE